MNLYLISQEKNGGYDTYDSAVVRAETEEEARNMHPSDRKLKNGTWYEHYPATDRNRAWIYASDWAEFPSDVKVEFIGSSTTGEPAGVVLGSYNAG